jgi:hypothetical protein
MTLVLVKSADGDWKIRHLHMPQPGWSGGLSLSS